MESKKKWTPRFLSPATLSLLFGTAVVGEVAAMEPVVNESIRLETGVAVTDTQNQNQNQNQNQAEMASAFKPGALRQIAAEMALS